MTLPQRYAPAERLELLRIALGARWLTYRDMTEMLHVSHATASRMLGTLSKTDALVEETADDGRRRFHIEAPALRPIRFTLSELVAMYVSRGALDPLAGTGLKEDLDSGAERMKAALRKHDAVLARDLEKKVFVVPQGRRRYDGLMDTMNDVVTGLLRQRSLMVTYDSLSTGRTTYRFDPYSLLLYRTGLYLAGYSHKHKKVITPALDHFAEIAILPDQPFEYPADYHPSRLVEGAFGIYAGTPEDVVLLFDAAVARFAERTVWHATQTATSRPDGSIELRMRVAAAKELKSWVFSWGATCEVLAPSSLREAVGELRRAAARYGG